MGGKRHGGQKAWGAKGMGGKRHGGQKTGGQKAGGQKAWGAKGMGGKRPGGKRPGGKRPGGKRPGGKRPGGKRPGGKSPVTLKYVKNQPIFNPKKWWRRGLFTPNNSVPPIHTHSLISGCQWESVGFVVWCELGLLSIIKPGSHRKDYKRLHTSDRIKLVKTMKS